MDYTGNNADNWNNDKVRFSFSRLVKMGFHVWRQFDDTYYQGFAAQLAYYFFMSSIPLIIVITQVLGYFEVSTDFIKDWLKAHLSTNMSGFIQGLFTASSATMTNIVMILLVLWSASSLTFNLSRLATYTLSGGKYRFFFFTERIKSMLLGLVAIVLMVSAVLVYVYGEMIAHRIFQDTELMELIARFKTPALGVLFFIIILINFCLIPRIRVPLMAIMPGAVVATIGIMLVTWFYSLYIEKSVKYNILYGAFSNIVALLLWFFCISWVICIGMMFNKSWDIHMKRGRLTPEKIKEYIVIQYGDNGEEMMNKLIIGDYDMYDRSLDTFSVKMSRIFDPGYNEKREREIRQLREEQRIRDKVEQEMRFQIDRNISDADQLAALDIDDDYGNDA